MAAKKDFTLFHASAVQAPGGFWLQIGLDGKNKLFRLSDKGVGINENPELSTVTLLDRIYTFEFDSHINGQQSKPCHVKLQIRLGAHPFENAASWLVTAPNGDKLMDSHGTRGDFDGDGWVLGNYGVKLEVK